MAWTLICPAPTARLRLRAWRDSDLAPFARLNADAQVMAHFPSVLSRADSDGLAARIRAHFDAHGFGFWALEVPGVTDFAGFVGLARPGFRAHFTPCVEIGWRLAREHWGRGYAAEAAWAAARFGFERLGLAEIVSFTAQGNHRSRRVMERIGMTRSPDDDFDHPSLAVEHRLARHVLYRLDAGRLPPAPAVTDVSFP